jgi:hypothetical protein
MFQYRAGMAKLNQQIAEQNADYALATGETTAFFHGLRTRAQIGAATARMGASGVAVGSGSSKDVLEGARYISGLEAAAIRNNAARQAYGYKVAATQEGAQAGLYGMAAESAQQAGKLGVLGSILGGVSSVSSKWLSGTSSGLFNTNPLGATTTSSYGGRLSELY